jgi:hypothetical protein
MTQCQHRLYLGEETFPPVEGVSNKRAGAYRCLQTGGSIGSLGEVPGRSAGEKILLWLAKGDKWGTHRMSRVGSF